MKTKKSESKNVCLDIQFTSHRITFRSISEDIANKVINWLSDANESRYISLKFEETPFGEKQVVLDKTYITCIIVHASIEENKNEKEK